MHPIPNMRITIDPTTVAANFAQFQNNPCVHESAQLFAKGLPVAEMIQAFAMNPSVLSAFAGFSAIYPKGQLERGVLEKVILCISRRNACQFCVESHLNVTRSLGIAGENAHDPHAEGHTVRERLAIEFAIAIHKDSNRIPDELYSRVSAVYQETEVVELAFLVGFINMLNWFNNALGVRYRSEFEGMRVA
jgi:AhpD family alkylhydroperoxidase